MKCTISTSDTLAAVGAYSQMTTNDELLLVARQLPLTSDGGLLDGASVDDQTERCLENMAVILAAEGASLGDVFKTTVFLDDIDDFEEFNEIYDEFFDGDPPARNTVEIGSVPEGATIRIEAVAMTE